MKHITLIQSLFYPLIFLTCTLLFSSKGLAQEPRIHYSVSIPDPESESFHVTADIYDIALDTMIFHFPIWAPGAYDVVNYGAFVSNLSVGGDEENSAQIVEVDSSTYQIINPPRYLQLVYRVQDIENLDNSAWFGLSDIEDTSGIAFANGPALFGYPKGYKEIPYTVTYTPPPGWNLAVALDPIQGTEGTFSARNYDELVDAPVQMGKFQQWEFKVDGIPHMITVTAPQRLSEEAGQELAKTTEDVVKLYSQFFGEMPYDRYLFQYYFTKANDEVQSFGALEHANSSTYLMPWVGEQSISNIMQPIISHEYWHLWSPKLIHVDELGPFDYQNLPATESLWFHEGLTEYYARVLLQRHRLRDPRDFFTTFSSHIADLYNVEQPEPITTLSRELPWRPIKEIYALYTKGPVLGLMLDAEIRLQTGNKKSLDDAMRHFNREYGDHTGGKNFDDDDIIPIIENATGTDLAGFYTNYIAGTKSFPFDEMLPKIGLEGVQIPFFGARMTNIRAGWRVRILDDHGCALRSGLQKNDTLVAVEVDRGDRQPVKSLDVKPAYFAVWIAQFADKEITLVIRRGGEEIELPLDIAFWQFAGVIPDPKATGMALEIRQSMLGL
ncbi:MAG: M61 family metallopeptidase [Chlorobi bacterium]|nr:M61 family metallopeptidase [Chlorobiota bacterium]